MHNLYLLWLAEVGLFGFIGVVLLGVASTTPPSGSAAARNRLFAGIGIGAAGAMAFLMVEELLGYTLRSDIPLALYWLLAGLVAACTTMSGAAVAGSLVALADPSRTQQPRRLPSAPSRQPVLTRFSVRRARAPRPGAGRRRHGSVCWWALAPTGSAAGTSSRRGRRSTGSGRLDPWPHLQRHRARDAGWTASTSPRRRHRHPQDHPPTTELHYNWGRFAFGNTKIVYTVRRGPLGSPEDIGLMNVDGIEPADPAALQLPGRPARHRPHRPLPALHRQGALLPAGRAVPARPDDRADHNITAVTRPNGGFDADPVLSVSSNKLLFVENNPGAGTKVGQMNTDGTNRQHLTSDRYFNTDPADNSDGSLVTIASYRGQGLPPRTSLDDPSVMSQNSVPDTSTSRCSRGWAGPSGC